MKPIIYMLCGMPAAGKSTYAQKLTSDKLPKLSMDEEVYKRYGRAGVDYPKAEYLERYEVIKAELEQKILELLKQKQSFILDYGYWRRATRDRHKKLIEEYGAEWKLIYLKASPKLVAKRIEKRNKRTDANAFPVTKAMLRDFIARFEEPHDEGEIIIDQDFSTK